MIQKFLFWHKKGYMIMETIYSLLCFGGIFILAIIMSVGVLLIMAGGKIKQ